MPDLQLPAKGDLLISEPFLADPNFERSVILICEHNDEGTLGFVLNKPTNHTLGEVVQEACDYPSLLHKGGPVQLDTLHFIHRTESLISGSNKIKENIFWGGDFEQLLSFINTRQVSQNDLMFFLGYSGWSPGQLEDELKENTWFVYKETDQYDVFEGKTDNLWRKVLKSMGGKFKAISNYPTDPRLN